MWDLDTRCWQRHRKRLTTNQLFLHPESGCAITADARIDYRDELITTLGLERSPAEIGDAELILSAYLRWGDRCPERLLGDFAFAIWDPRNHCLFCARDPFGMRPLYYHYSATRRFVFASDARAILLLEHVPYRINEGRIADFLVPSLEWVDYESTFFEGVHRVPSANAAYCVARRSGPPSVLGAPSRARAGPAIR